MLTVDVTTGMTISGLLNPSKTVWDPLIPVRAAGRPLWIQESTGRGDGPSTVCAVGVMPTTYFDADRRSGSLALEAHEGLLEARTGRPSGPVRSAAGVDRRLAAAPRQGGDRT